MPIIRYSGGAVDESEAEDARGTAEGGMMSELIVPLIMCGGAGTRLWPASREGRPKQFLPLLGPLSTFQQTLKRVSDPGRFGRPIVITNGRYRFLVSEQVSMLGLEADILLEPARRDSGPAIAAGAAFAQRRDGDPVIVALAADHVMNDPLAFAAACDTAREAAESGSIVTFGVRPSRVAMEYGYIRPGQAMTDSVFTIAAFVEKPDLANAERFVAEGYLWNSGNFMFRAGAFLDEYAAFEPSSAQAVIEAVTNAGSDLCFITLDAGAFAQASAKSVDYAVMERTRRAAVVPVSYGWSDVGSWNAVWELSTRDASGNAAQGPAFFLESSDSFVSSDRALVSLFGVKDLAVIATQDAILVARRDDPDGLRRLVQKLKDVDAKVTEEHLQVHRPWGSYQALDAGSRYQVKRIVVSPGCRLSLQLHHHRAEHWVVVRGIAEVTVGAAVRTLHENESIYIPLGTQHRLANLGADDLELIEVQTGAYLGEDDIVRIEDDYQRS